MFSTFDEDLQLDSEKCSTKEITIDTVIEELERGQSEPDAVVTTRLWLQIPNLIRDCDRLKEENPHKMDRLIQNILQILNMCLRKHISLINRRLLHSSLSTLATSPTLPTEIRVGVEQCLVPLNSLEEGPFVLVSADEFKSMEDDSKHNLSTTSTQKDEINQLNHTIATLQQQHKEDEEKLMKEREEKNAKVGEMEAMLTKEREKRIEAETEVVRAKEREQASEVARREAEARNEHLLTENKTLTNNLTESRDREKKADEREMKANDDRRGAEQTRIQMEEEKKKAEADRAMMEKEKRQEEEKRRSAEDGKRIAEERLKNVEEQARREKERLSDEVKNTQKELGEVRAGRQKSENENRGLILQIDKLKQQLAHLPIWLGTESLQTVDRTAHRLSSTTLTQIVSLGSSIWRTVFTFPVTDGEWELKIKANENTFQYVMLGFIKHPLPEDATQRHCGTNAGGIGGDFTLWDGGMWKNGEFKPEGTNKICDRVGQTAAIRVNMSTRQARLFVDDQEQPGIFTNIHSPLCLGITTHDQNKQIEVMWFKQLRS
ncbi:hypothetical protein BLNAU_1993 [Blattamonas nauphoetae]|uniref:Uncharacterized protein n=1 Tax=Blattamonas nauphoetae TaxID=2049346 RepID=A0ABQ9YGV1_9EUKA|nr:hypothetical protein BLNAU_1993 [Blattamonas nauphoetae]